MSVAPVHQRLGSVNRSGSGTKQFLSHDVTHVLLLSCHWCSLHHVDSLFRFRVPYEMKRLFNPNGVFNPLEDRGREKVVAHVDTDSPQVRVSKWGGFIRVRFQSMLYEVHLLPRAPVLELSCFRTGSVQISPKSHWGSRHMTEFQDRYFFAPVAFNISTPCIMLVTISELF